MPARLWNSFEINVVSPPQYDALVVEVEAQGGTVFYLTEERGGERYTIDLPPREDLDTWSIDIEVFKQLIDTAVAQLRAV